MQHAACNMYMQGIAEPVHLLRERKNRSSFRAGYTYVCILNYL